MHEQYQANANPSLQCGLHIAIWIRRWLFQAVRVNWFSGWKPDSKHEGPKFNSRLRKKTKKTHTKSKTWIKALVAQRQSVYNIVGHPTWLAKVRTTDGYRLISGRSQDRNLSGAWIQEGVKANKLEPTKPIHPHSSEGERRKNIVGYFIRLA